MIQGVSIGRCCWGSCSGLNKSEESGAKRSRATKCTTMDINKTISYCANAMDLNVVIAMLLGCHQLYHAKYHKKHYGDFCVCSFIVK